MKYLFTITSLALIITALVSFKSGFTGTTVPETPQQETSGFVVPDDVKVILDKSCLPCHGTDGNFKAKAKWNYDKMADLKKTKQISKLSKIVSKVEKGKMPTAKFIKKNPDKNLTPDDKILLISWADGLAESLIK
jgi:hypothetical protein